jgi:hypothetical protein
MGQVGNAAAGPVATTIPLLSLLDAPLSRGQSALAALDASGDAAVRTLCSAVHENLDSADAWLQLLAYATPLASARFVLRLYEQATTSIPMSCSRDDAIYIRLWLALSRFQFM